MEWSRIPTDLIFQKLTDNELVAIVKYQSLWAQFERQPDDKTALMYMTHKQLIIAKSYQDSINMCVTSDIDSVNKKRTRNKKYYEKQTLSENSDVLDKIRLDKKEKESKKKNETTKFTPPTFEEVKAYIAEKNLQVNPEKFFNYFDVGNWVDSKGNKVRNWKQKIITWNDHLPKQEEDDDNPWKVEWHETNGFREY